MKQFLAPLLLVCFFSSVHAQAPRLTRGPYLQVVTQTGITIRWRTDTPQASRVWIGTAATALNQSVTDPAAVTEHIVSVTGLSPATRYFYAIGQGETRLSGDANHSFKTALPAGDTRPFRIWSLGDFGNGTQNQTDVYEQYKKATANRPADLWLWMGDNAYCCGTDEEYQKYIFDVYGPHLRSLPSYPVPGNHDYADQNQKFDSPYFSVFSFADRGQAGGVPSGSKLYYSFDYGNVHFVMLDSFGLEDGKWILYDPTSPQVRWLERDLAANQASARKQTWTVVVFHHPPYTKTARDSDAEEALRLLRENLTPILERYNVDMVMNGHSHTYERTYRIRDHRGLAATFDPAQHLAETTTARYDGSPNSCPILTKGKGIVYVVNGSGGALGGAYFNNPNHPAMATTFKTIGGSLVLDVNDNRMDAQFIAADGSIQDRFTIMKNVGQSQRLTAEYGDTLQLSSSWPADSYRWNEAGQTARTARFTRRQAGTFTVTATDDRNCLRDDFAITISARPKITATLVSAATLCQGQLAEFRLLTENTSRAQAWTYDLQLSDKNGSFERPQMVGTQGVTLFNVVIPRSLEPGAGYQIRAVPRQLPDAELIASVPITVLAPAAAIISGSATVQPGTPASVSLTLMGSGPWSGTLTNGTTFVSETSPVVLPVSPSQTTTYAIANLRNGCGAGIATGQAVVTVLLPTATETFAGGQISVYPNPTTGSVTLDLTLNKPQESEVDVVDATGRVVQQFMLKAATHQQRVINLPQPGVFSIRVRVAGSVVVRKVVKQ
ncbi:MAG: metallophosphoesterase [Rudanella sp.]|nr:metallophosphoesterase [Rudanella sp.]